MKKTLRNALCAVALAFVTSAPAGATIIASFDWPSYGIGYAGFGDVKTFAPLFSVSVGGADTFSAVPSNGTNVYVLGGSALATMAAELSDGASDSYAFKLVLDSVNEQFGLALVLFESNFTGASNLPGASILGVRISLIDLCMQPTTAGGCAFPGPGWVGFNSQLRIEVSDTPFPEQIPEPGTAFLLLVAGLALGVARGARRLG